MPPIVSFIGFHDSGKTTLASQVVAHLKERGYRLAVVKSTKERGLVFDQAGTDTAIHRRAGADAVALIAPDQLVMFANPPTIDLKEFAERFFPDMDIVIAEGFKDAQHIAKIEVYAGHGARLQDRVSGVIAVVSDVLDLDGRCFGRHESKKVADFIVERFL